MITLVIGRRVQGKTTLAYHSARRSPTVIIFDPRGSFDSDVVSDTDIYEALDTMDRIVIHPEGDVVKSFELVCEQVRDWLRDNPQEEISFLVDEARFIDSPAGVPEAFDHIIRFSSVKNVNVFLTAHRPSDIAVDIRAIADYWCMFRSTQEHDLKVIEGRCGPTVADQVQNLGPKEFVVWNDGEAKSHVNREPHSWYIPLNPVVNSENTRELRQ